MNILELLSSNSYLTVNKTLAKKVGLEEAVLFADLAGSQLYWYSQNRTDNEGWFYRTQKEIEEQTTLSAKVQSRCIKNLIEFGLVKTKLKGLPAVTHYHIGELEVTNLINLFSQKVNTSLAEREKLDSPKWSTIYNINIKNNNIDNNNKEYRESSFSQKNEESVFDLKYYSELCEILGLLTELTQAKYNIPKTADKVKKYKPYTLIKELFESGFNRANFVDVINCKYKEWAGSSMAIHLVPETLFRKSNFEKYVTQTQIITNKQNIIKDAKGKYADTNEGRKLFISNIREGASKLLSDEF